MISTFLLVEPREEGNVGMVARAMANFALSRLVLINAPGRPDSTDLVTARSEGRRVLDAVEQAPDLPTALEPFHTAIGVSRRTGKHRPRDLGPSDLGTFLSALPEEARVAFVFGREADGLRSDEVARCGRLFAIPTAADAPSLNLAQAAVITAFTIFMNPAPAFPREEMPAAQADLEPLWTDLEQALETIGFLQGDRAVDAITSLRRILARSLPSDRELRLLRSLARKIGAAGRSPAGD